MPAIRYQDLASRNAGEPSETIRQRVNNARDVQLQRFQKRNIHANAQMGARDIKRYCAVNDDAEKLLETAINKLGLSARANTFGGIVRAICLAVLRLITSSNFVGRFTGSSAGLVT